MVDTATERETRARETIQNLKVEIANLTKLVEQGAGLSIGRENRQVSKGVANIFYSYNNSLVQICSIDELCLVVFWEVVLVNSFAYNKTYLNVKNKIFNIYSVNELVAAKESITRERDQLQLESIELKEKLATISNQQLKLEEQLEGADEKIAEVC